MRAMGMQGIGAPVTKVLGGGESKLTLVAGVRKIRATDDRRDKVSLKRRVIA